MPQPVLLAAYEKDKAGCRRPADGLPGGGSGGSAGKAPRPGAGALPPSVPCGWPKLPSSALARR
ncbi:MAG: hypothetical protein ACLVJH_18975 [Faecalibacterium prausnitzii]